MEDVLRWTLFIVGTLAIAGVLIHGLWVSRRSSGKSKSKAQFEAGRRHGVNSERSSEPSFSLDDDSDNAHEQKGGFDDLGVGPVRVVSNHKVATDETTSEPPLAPVTENQENTAKSF
ncbi:MAG: cell division protein ZipA, partial [Paraglaciecola chathamensis]